MTGSYGHLFYGWLIYDLKLRSRSCAVTGPKSRPWAGDEGRICRLQGWDRHLSSIGFHGRILCLKNLPCLVNPPGETAQEPPAGRVQLMRSMMGDVALVRGREIFGFQRRRCERSHSQRLSVRLLTPSFRALSDWRSPRANRRFLRCWPTVRGSLAAKKLRVQTG
jgi:hypothetical protein